MFPLGTLVGAFQKNSPCTWWVKTGQIVQKLTTNSQCAHQVRPPLPPVSAGPLPSSPYAYVSSGPDASSLGSHEHCCHANLEKHIASEDLGFVTNQSISPLSPQEQYNYPDSKQPHRGEKGVGCLFGTVS